MLLQFLLLSLCVSVATAKVITGVFNSFDSLTWTRAGNYAYKGPNRPTWNAVLGWSLDGTSANPGDTFTLNMPCVFKFITDQTSVDLTADGVKYATCQFYSGEEFTTFSSLKCTVSNTLTSSIKALGTVTLPISFNVGGTGSLVDLESSKCFKAGTNTVTFNDGDKKISIDVDFEKTNEDASGYFIASRLIPSINKVSITYVAPQCANGYTSGAMGFIVLTGDTTIDCSNVHVGITKGLNDWNFPVSSDSLSYNKTCSSTGISITYENVPAGYRPFFDVYTLVSGQNRQLRYTNDYACVGSSLQSKPFNLRLRGYNNSEANSNGFVIVATTRTVTDSTTAVTTLPFNPSIDKTKTIEILQPIPTTTITTSYVGVTTSYLTKTAPIGETATVIVDVPYHTTTTVTSEWTGTITTTTTRTNPTDSIDTVVVQVPLPNPTVSTTEYWSQSYATTTTVTAPPGGTDTVIIREPPNHTVTTTEYWSQSFATTTTVTAPPGGTDTVIIREPPNYTVTTTEYWSQSFATTTTVTAPPGGTDTVIIYESMSSSKISTSSNDITSIIPSFSRPHYVNSTTSDLSTFESSSMNTPTSISSDGMLLSSTTLVTESETTTELICSDGKECSRLSSSSGIVTNPDSNESSIVTSTVPTASTMSDSLSSTDGISATSSDNVSKSGVSVTTETSVTTIQTTPNPLSSSVTSLTQLSSIPSVSESESKVTFTSNGDNQSGTHDSQSTSTEIEIVTTSSTKVLPPVVSSNTDLTSEPTNTREQPTTLSTTSNSITEDITTSQPTGDNGDNTSSTNPVPTVATSTLASASEEDNKSGSHESASTSLKPSMGENSGLTTSTEIEATTTSPTEAPSPAVSSGTDVTTEPTDTREQPTTLSTTSKTNSELVATTQATNENGGKSPSTDLTSSLTTGTSASTSANSELVTSGSVTGGAVASASNDQSHSTSVTNSNSIVSNTPQTTLSQQVTSSSPSTNTFIASTYDGSGSIIQHSTWLYGLITLLSLFI